MDAPVVTTLSSASIGGRPTPSIASSSSYAVVEDVSLLAFTAVARASVDEECSRCDGLDIRMTVLEGSKAGRGSRECGFTLIEDVLSTGFHSGGAAAAFTAAMCLGFRDGAGGGVCALILAVDAAVGLNTPDPSDTAEVSMRGVLDADDWR